MKLFFLPILFLLVIAWTPAQTEEPIQKNPLVLSVINYADADQLGYEHEVWIWDFIKQQMKGKATIKYEELFKESFHQKVQDYAVANQLPDIIYLWASGHSEVLHRKHLVKDLSPLVGKEFLNNYIPLAVDPRMQAGSYLAIIPNSVIHTHIFWANTAVLGALGLKPAATYEELKAQIPVIKKAGLEVILMDNKDNWPLSVCLFSTVAGRMAGNHFLDDVMAGKAKFTDKPWVDSLRFIQTLFKDGAISKNTFDIGYGDLLELWATNKAAYYVDGDWRIGDYTTNKETGKSLISPDDQKKILLGTFPTIPGQLPGSPETSSVVGSGFGISASIPAGSPREKAAVEVIKLLAGPEVQKDRLSAGTSFPSRTDVEIPKDMDPLQQQYGHWIKSVRGGAYLIDAVLDPKICTTLFEGLQQIARETASPEQVAQAMDESLERWRNPPAPVDGDQE